MRFTKLHGCGNDYLYVDCITQPAPADPPALAREISDRHFGVGSDGLILVLPSRLADVRMRMFNADGSEGRMCGNGVRGLAKFAFDRGLARANPMSVETLRGVLTIDLHLGLGGKVDSATVDMDEPILEAARIPVLPPRAAGLERVIDVPLAEILPDFPGGAWTGASALDPRLTCVSMGSAHAVLFCREVSAVPLEQVGPALERHAIFPERINVHFAQVLAPGELRMRTWEKGSGVTLACGTGACAVVVAAVLTGRGGRAATVQLPGGALTIEWRESNNRVYMTGPVVEVFSGEW